MRLPRAVAIAGLVCVAFFVGKLLEIAGAADWSAVMACTLLSVVLFVMRRRP